MKIRRITVDGFANIDNVSLSLSNLCALLAFNNYGKSNILKAISFGIELLTVGSQGRSLLLRKYFDSIPINKITAGRMFKFNLELETSNNEQKSIISYGYKFAWPTEHSAPQFHSEYLKIKEENVLKLKKYIIRDKQECTYLSTPLGRCSSKINIDTNQLAIEKLSNYDNLFYNHALKSILGLRFIEMNTLADPKTFFRTISIKGGRPMCSSNINSMPVFGTCASFAYSLKEENKDKYNLLKDAIKQLIPSIIDFEPVKIDLKKQTSVLKGDINIPFNFPEHIYDIRVLEKNINQQITIDKLSSGTKRIFYILIMAIAAEMNKMPLVLIEELENSIHPSLFQKLLTIIKTLIGDTQVIITSHSPYVLQYIKPELLYLGIPNENDVAIFKQIKKSKIKSLMLDAATYDMSLGDYLFDMMLEIDNDTNELVTKYFE